MPDKNMTAAQEHIAAGRLPEAIIALSKAVDGPSGRQALLLLAQLFRQLDRPEDAMRALETLLARSPGDEEGRFQLANLAAEMGAADGAQQIYRDLLRERPDSLPIRNNLANLLRALHRAEEGLRVIEPAMAAGRGDANLLTTYGLCALECGDLEAARRAFEEALSVQPEHGEARANLGELLLLAGDRETGISTLMEAMRNLAPAARAQAEVNLAYAHFLDGDWQAGWTAFESRFAALPPTERPPRPFGQPRWQGEPLDGKLLVWGEQGVGDEIIYAGMLADAADRVPGCVLECEPRLAPLLARSFPEVEVLSRADPPAPRLAAPDLVAQIPIASLGALFRKGVEDFPRRPAYLRADPDLRAVLRERYRSFGEGPLVGLSWRSVNARAGPAKSLSLEGLVSILGARPAVFVNLQYGDVAAEIGRFRDSSGIEVIADPAVDQMRDMDAFAAQVAAMDLVVSVSNTAAHVAGGLGRPVWTMVPAGPGLRWYWGREGAACPWYPTMRLYRQPAPGRWQEVVDAVAGDFRDLDDPSRGSA